MQATVADLRSVIDNADYVWNIMFSVWGTAHTYYFFPPRDNINILLSAQQLLPNINSSCLSLLTWVHLISKWYSSDNPDVVHCTTSLQESVDPKH